MVDTVEWYGDYFKPFYPTHLLVMVSLLNLIPQYIAMKVKKGKNNDMINSK